MSTRQPAPGQLELVRAFVNSAELDRETDEFDSPARLAGWLDRHGLLDAGPRAVHRDLARAVALREAVRSVLAFHNDGTPAPTTAVREFEAAAGRARLRLRFLDPASTVLEPDSAGVDAALGRLLAIVHGSIMRGTWLRLKVCRQSSCGWAFYDHSKNHSRAWCAMEVCGNRAKARAYRERRSSAGA